MKNLILIFTIALILLGCTKDETYDYINVKERVERDLNGDGVSNQKVLLKINQIHGTGYWSYTTIIDSKEVITDSNGNFNVPMKSGSNIYISAYKFQDDNYTSFGLSDSNPNNNFNPNDNIILKVHKLLKFKIYVNNTNPLDLNDYIFVDFFTGNGETSRTKIENFGLQNTFYPAENLPGGGMIGAHEDASWKGTNVNSIVYYNVSENSEQYKIYWIKRKNGVETTGATAEIPFQANQVNEYHFNY